MCTSFSQSIEYPLACSTELEPYEISYFQIHDATGNVLEATSTDTIALMPNHLKDSQFWYLHKEPDSDYGYIGSKLYYSQQKVLSITLGDNVGDNGGYKIF